MNKYVSSYKRKRTDEVNELVAYYKQQRSFSSQDQPTTSSGLPSLNSLTLTPWDYNLDANIVIKTEKDLALDERDFEFNLESEPQGSNVTPKEYFNWLNMENMNIGDKNSVSFASMMTDASSYEEQYLSLKIFLAACNTSYKRELSSILFPVFLHFYLDLIAKPDFSAAQSFFNKFHHDHDEQHKDVTSSLQKITITNQILLYSNIKDMRSYKTSIKLSPPVYLYLLQHLRHGNYTLILQTLNRHFSVKTSSVSSSNKYSDDSEQVGHDEELFERVTPSYTPAEQQSITNLQKSISAFRSSTKILKPSICLYSFVNGYHGLTCASFCNNDSILAAGFEDSSVRYWNIVAKNKLDTKTSEEDTPNTDLMSSGKECHILRGHSGIVYQVKFHPDEIHLLSSSQDKSVRLWNVNTSKCLVEYRGHNYSVFDTSSSPHGHYFASASMDRTARLWNIECAYPLRIFSGHNESVDCVAFHPNGNYIATGSTDKSCRLWDLQTGQFVRVFVGHKAPIRTLTFTKDGKYLLSGGEDATIMVWDLSNGQILNEIHGHKRTIYSLTFSSDSTMLASGGLDSTVKVWESESLLKKSSNLLLKSKHDIIGSYPTNLNSIMSLKFSLGNLLLITGLVDGR